MVQTNLAKRVKRLTAPTHNIRSNKLPFVTMYVVLHSNFAMYTVCRCFRLCKSLAFIWTNWWGSWSYYAITSQANSIHQFPLPVEHIIQSSSVKLKVRVTQWFRICQDRCSSACGFWVNVTCPGDMSKSLLTLSSRLSSAHDVSQEWW